MSAIGTEPLCSVVAERSTGSTSTGTARVAAWMMLGSLQVVELGRSRRLRSHHLCSTPACSAPARPMSWPDACASGAARATGFDGCQSRVAKLPPAEGHIERAQQLWHKPAGSALGHGPQRDEHKASKLLGGFGLMASSGAGCVRDIESTYPAQNLQSFQYD